MEKRGSIHFLNFKLMLILINIFVFALIFSFFYKTLDNSFLSNNSGEIYGASFPDLRIDLYSELEAELEANVHSCNGVIEVRDCGDSVETQAKQIMDMAYSGAGTIFVCPVKSFGLEDTFEKCREMGIQILTVGNLAANKDNINYAVSSENYEAGVQMSSCLAGTVESGKILIIGEENSLTSDERIAGFVSLLSQNDNYKISKTVLNSGKAEEARDAVLEKIKNEGKFDAVFAVTDRIGMGAYAAIKKRGHENDTRILTVDGSPDGRKMVEAGRFLGSSGQYPSVIAKRAVELAGSEGGTGQEVRVPVRLITRNTITSYNLSKWD